MKQPSLKHLLRNLIHWRITPDEYTELKREVETSDDESIDTALEALWEESEPEAMDISVKEQIRHKLNLHLSPAHQMTPTHQNSPARQRKAAEWWNASGWWKVAAIAIPVLFCLSSYLYFSSVYPGADATFTVFTEKGQKTRITLPDGSQVCLNSDSRLSYNSGFSKKNRTLQLEGEAFFDVAPDKENTFTVQTGKVDVVVHGTAFNVSSYKDEPTMSVTLVRGKVSLANHATGQTLTMMAPNELASVSKTDLTWGIESCDAEMESLWTRNTLKFENVPANKVFKKLERWYGVDIHVENPNPETSYGFTLKTESLREILEIINKVSPITYHINGEEVNIRYK